MQQVTWMENVATAPARIDMGGPRIHPALRQGHSRITVTPLEKRLEAYRRFQGLSGRGKSTHELVIIISKQFGVSQQTVYAWTKGTSPFGRRCGRIAYTKELFYVIGSMLGDGCIYFWKKHYFISLVGELEFAAKFAKKVSVCTTKRHAKAYPYRGRNVWLVSFQNAELYFLIREIREHLGVLSDLLSLGDRSVNALQLVEGFFDAEGCVKVIKERVRRTPKTCLDFCNTNIAFLKLIRETLKDALGIEGRFTSQKGRELNRKVSYHLRIYRKDAIRKFLLHVRTIKLKPEKVQYVKNWLGKK
ncbi:MAG: LAGLIDADG family homing endonuclease [Candidatus Bathyarchaeia archaeon]